MKEQFLCFWQSCLPAAGVWARPRWNTDHMRSGMETNGSYIDFRKHNRGSKVYLMVSDMSRLYGDLVIPARWMDILSEMSTTIPLLRYAFELCGV